MVAGTQADQPGKNKLFVMKVSDLHRTEKDDLDAEDDDNDDDDDDLDDDPILEYKTIKHKGGVNRVRSMPQQSNIVATWSDTSNVHVFDIAPHMAGLDEPGSPIEIGGGAGGGAGGGGGGGKNPHEVFSFAGHKDEGYAMDWSKVEAGRLVTGDCSNAIHAWVPTDGGSWEVDPSPFHSHTDSVEDLQWSPNEATVFGSCSVDQTVKIWDTRAPTKASMLSVHAHDTDVNVIGWNALVRRRKII